MKSYSAPPPELFVRENTSAPENRLNLALFAILSIDALRETFLHHLTAPKDCVIYPPQNVQPGRPDFVVVNASAEVVAWIEVELGGENESQLSRYRTGLDEPVISIVGPADAKGDLALETLAESITDEVVASLSPQQKIAVRMFRTLVNECITGVARATYAVPEFDRRQVPVVRELELHLGDAFEAKVPPPKPGIVQLSTMTQKGWTLRVYAPGAGMKSVGLLHCRGIGSRRVQIPSAILLNRCLPDRKEAVERYLQYWDMRGVDLRALSEYRAASVDDSVVLQDVPALAKALRDLAHP